MVCKHTQKKLNTHFINWSIGFLTEASLIQNESDLSQDAINEKIRNDSIQMVESILELMIE
jgi:hypothetical protein